jgi:hypothetical protein
MTICRRNTNLVKIGHKYRTIYMQNYVRFSIGGDIKSPLKHFLLVIWYQAVRVAQEVYTLGKRAMMLSYTYTA